MKNFMILFFTILLCNLSASIINIPDDYLTIQEGINVATSNDTVLIHPGTYYESLTLHNGSTIGSLYLTTQDTSFICQTVIDANQNDFGVKYWEGNGSPNLIGFTIRNASWCGLSIGSNNLFYGSNMIITENYYGIWVSENLDFILYDSIISNNLLNGVNAGPSAHTNLINLLICNNGGSGLSIGECSSDIYNTTFINNYASISAFFGFVDLINCILWGSIDYEIVLGDDGNISSMYSNIQGGETGINIINSGTVNWLEGNIDEDPLFEGTGDHPFMLQDLSPCVNAGIPDTTGLNLTEFDLTGNLRVFGGRIDMGAYENQNVVVNTDENLIPLVTKLNQNYPNPFNPSTTIEFSIPEESKIELSIYNIKGQKIKSLLNEQIQAGEHSIIWNGEDATGKQVGSGVYLYKLIVNGKTEAVRKCLLLK